MKLINLIDFKYVAFKFRATSLLCPLGKIITDLSLPESRCTLNILRMLITAP